MRDRIHYIIKSLFYIYILGLCFCCFWNFRGSIDLSTEWIGLPKDKVVHFLLFFPMPVMTYLAFPKLRNTPRRYLRFSIIVFICSIAFGAMTEAVQWLTGYRQCDWGDLLADCCGIAAAIAVLQIYEAFIKNWRDSGK